MFARENHISWVRYFTEVAKCKKLAQWKARLNALKCPIEGTMNVRTPMECGRLMALLFMHSLTTAPSADLRDRSNWITQEFADWLA